MPKVIVDKELCKSCGLCVGACPKHILRINTEHINAKGYFYAEQFDSSQCIGCKLCAVMCPDSAISVYK